MNFHKFVIISFLIQFLNFRIGAFDMTPDFIAYLMMAYAFFKQQGLPYAKAGMICSLLLTPFSMIDSILAMQVEVNQASFVVMLFSLTIGLLNIFYFICIFAVSNTLVDDSSQKFPAIFIGALVLVNVTLSFIMHISPDVGAGLLIVVMVLFFCCYVYFAIFIWKRIKIEDAVRAEQLRQLVE